MRERLVAAGSALAEECGLAALTVDRIVERAGCAKGSFFTHFPSRAEFFVALHRAFHERVAAAVEAAIAGQPPGLARLLHGSLAYLDACRREHSVKALLVEARLLPEIGAGIHRQNLRFDALAAVEFGAAGWPAPRHAGRLWVALVAEAALAETEGSRRLAPLRGHLARFLGIAGPA